ncbi:universal stress protein [Halococcus thailandensis]|uniref:Universal stress protein uspa-like protein n=1 Tax=Halococcus thailandensis JCM 13552 TaxID=1227457 RepID=M0N2T5_9EURY|nr:universal stress protein [Halococcus thailandensis]EMA52262.1 universal stress protein uspa-like protein [Halococcus thailandensis JCM 13552]
MYDHVLLPTDGSEAAMDAENEAFEITTTNDATLHVLFVVDETAGPLNVRGGDERFEEAESEGEETVSEIVDRATEAGVEDVTDVVRRGVPHEEILDYADEYCDLVVMGTRGRSGLDRQLLGSVTEKVVRRSNPSVLTVRVGSEGT